MQSKNILFAFVFCVVLYTTLARKHHHKSTEEHSHTKVHSHEHEELKRPEKRAVHAGHSRESHSHVHHHHKREAEHVRDQHVESYLRTGNEKPLEPGHDHHHHDHSHHIWKRQASSSGSGAPAPTGSHPPIAVPDMHLDVGKVNVESQVDSCNGVLLEPTFILTSATCVYENHTADAYANISFTLGDETKPVRKVFRNPYWHLTGERKENFALLQLQQPVAHIHQKQLTSMTWSSYGLEDLGDTYIAQSDNTLCTAASDSASKGDTIRHVNDELVTLSCGDKGTMAAGSPIFRLVNGAPVIYGVYFGHCTTGSLDDSTSGSCAARISKQVFLDFCAHARTENVDLHACDNRLLNETHTNFPTTVFTESHYNVSHDREHNARNVILAYHSSASTHFQSFVEDMETIQRMKSVFDQFHIAVIDVNILPFQVKAVPFIEYRTKSSDAFIPYETAYEHTSFKTFMDKFGKVGAPPITTIPTAGPLLTDVPVIRRVQSYNMPESAGERFVDRNSPCDTTAGYWIVPNTTCACLPTYFGLGTTGNCEDLETVLEGHCDYSVDGTPTTYENIKTAAAVRDTWCSSVKKISVEIKGGATVRDKTITPLDCANAITDKIACLNNNRLQVQHDAYPNATIFNDNTHFSRRSSVNTKESDAPPTYTANFEGGSPPSPMTHAPNTHYFTVTGDQGATPYSVLFDGNTGIPWLVASIFTNAKMKMTPQAKSWLRNKWALPSPTDFKGRIGSDEIYFGRGVKSSPEAVEEGQLNPVQMHSHEDDSMDVTFNHLNAFPQYSDFSRGVWRKYQDKIITYARTICSDKDDSDDSATFHVISGLSNYEIKGVASHTYAFLTQATYWPVAYQDAVPQPNGSPTLTDGVKSIVQPKSVWTVGCCTWTKNGEQHAQAVSIWANNKPRGIPKHEIQPDLLTLGKRLFPGKQCFHFFPANAQCNIPENHYTMAP